MIADVLSPAKLESLSSAGFAVVDNEDRKSLAGSATVVKEVDTFTSGMIRVYQLKDDQTKFYVEEENQEESMFVLREFDNQLTVDAFIKDREESYALMWGSCCAGKVKYCARFQADQ